MWHVMCDSVKCDRQVHVTCDVLRYDMPVVCDVCHACDMCVCMCVCVCDTVTSDMDV